MNLGFTKSKYDSILYYKVEDEEIMILLFYVDNLFLTRKEMFISECKKNVATKFEMNYLGTIHCFLGLEVWKFHGENFPEQRKVQSRHFEEIWDVRLQTINTLMVKKLKLLNDDYSERVDVTLHRHIIGSLMYLTNTRPDICFSMNTLSQYMVEPRHVHLVVTKHVIRYLKGTLDCGLRYTTDSEFTLCGFTYLDWEGIVEDRNRTLRHCFIWDQL